MHDQDREHGEHTEHSEWTGSEKPRTITPEWRVPLYVVGSAVALAVYGTVLYQNLKAEVSDGVNFSQVQHWIDEARQRNPNINWPPLPEKHSATVPVPDHYAIVSRTEIPHEHP